MLGVVPGVLFFLQFKRLQGKRNRGREEINFVDIKGDDQLSGAQQWLTKSLTEEKTMKSFSKVGWRVRAGVGAHMSPSWSCVGCWAVTREGNRDLVNNDMWETSRVPENMACGWGGPARKCFSQRNLQFNREQMLLGVATCRPLSWFAVQGSVSPG